jgi:hypothetical protein
MILLRELQRSIKAAAALRRHVEQLNDRMERLNNADNMAGQLHEDF